MADFEANIGSTSGLGGFATAMPGAIDEWIRQNEAQRQFEAEGRLQQALAPFKEQMAKSQAETGMYQTQMEGAKAGFLAQAIAGMQGGEPGQPMNEMQRNALGLKGRDPQIVLGEKVLLEKIKQAGLLQKGQQLIKEHEESSGRLLEKRQELQQQRPPTQSQVLGGILQAEIDGKATPGMKAAWRMAHPLEGKILDTVERELLHNLNYTQAVAAGDVATASKLRQEAMERNMTFMGMNPSQEQEEAFAAEEEGTPAPEAPESWLVGLAKLLE